MRTSIAGAVSLAKRATCAEIEQRVAQRDRRAGAAIAAAMRRQVPDVGARVETTDRWAVEFEAQVAVVECLGRPEPSERYAVVSTAWFGFGDADEQPPLRVELTVHAWSMCHWSATELALAQVRRARVRAIVAYVVDQAVAVRDEDYSDVSAYVDEAAAELLALGVGPQATR